MTRPAASLRRLPRWCRVALALAGFKLGYGLVALGMVWWGVGFDEPQAERIRQGWFPAEAPPAAHGRWARHFATWDAEHYLYLSGRGYAPGLKSAAFYPLWPLVVRAAAPLAGGSHLVAGLVLANLFSLAGWVVFHRVAARRFGEGQADVAVALLVVFPGSLFFQFLYSEALFFLLLMGLWWALEERRDVAAGAAALLLPLARGVGVFAVLPIGWVLWARWKEEGRRRKEDGEMRMEDGGRRMEDEPAATSHAMKERVEDGLQAPSHSQEALTPALSQREREAARAAAHATEHPSPLPSAIFQPLSSILSSRWYLLLLAPLAGWGIYLALMGHWTGNPWAGVEAQRHWGVQAISNLWDVPKFVGGFLNVTTWHGFTGSLLDRVVFLLVLYSLPVQWRLGRDLPAWTLMLAVVPAVSGTLVSFVRFASCAFPLFLAGAAVLAPLRRRWPLILVLAACGALHLVLLWRFLNYSWAG